MKNKVKVLTVMSVLIAALSLTFVMTACGGVDESELSGELRAIGVFRIENHENGGHSGSSNFLSDNNGVLGTTAQNGANNLWVVMTDGTRRALKNHTTENFINIKSLTPAWNTEVPVSPFEDDPSFFWDFNAGNPGTNIRNTDGYLSILTSVHESDRAYTVNWRNEAGQDQWGAAQWTFWEATDL